MLTCLNALQALGEEPFVSHQAFCFGSTTGAVAQQYQADVMLWGSLISPTGSAEVTGAEVLYMLVLVDGLVWYPVSLEDPGASLSQQLACC